jgi:hypothetical protein
MLYYILHKGLAILTSFGISGDGLRLEIYFSVTLGSCYVRRMPLSLPLH